MIFKASFNSLGSVKNFDHKRERKIDEEFSPQYIQLNSKLLAPVAWFADQLLVIWQDNIKTLICCGGFWVIVPFNPIPNRLCQLILYHVEKFIPALLE